MPQFSGRRRQSKDHGSERLTVRRSKDSRVLPARRDKNNKKLTKFPTQGMPGYDPVYGKILPDRVMMLPHMFAEYMPEFFNAYWQFVHAVSFLPAQPEVTEEMLMGVQIFFENFGLPENYFPDCASGQCRRHYRAYLEDPAVGGIDYMCSLVWNKNDPFALARWVAQFHDTVHERRREDNVNLDIVKRSNVPFERVKEYYMMNCGPPFNNSIVECWLYTQFNLNVRKDMCRISNTALRQDLYKSFGRKIHLLYQDIYPYGCYNVYWRRSTHVSDGYMIQTTTFHHTVVKAISMYCMIQTIALRLLTTHAFVLDKQFTDETHLVFMAMFLTILIISKIGVSRFV